MPKAKSIQFRFKSPVASISTPPSQSLLVSIDNSDYTQFAAVLEHTIAATSGSYSGSIINPDSVYGTLKFIHEDIALSASIELPFLNGEWWSTMITQETISGGYSYTIYAGSKVYDGVDGNTVGFQASASFTGSLDWKRVANNYLPGSGSRDVLGETYIPFTGSVQELRYFSTVVTEDQFRDYVQDSNSIEGSSGLFFRAALGGELFTASSSIHPRAGGFGKVNSFTSGNGFTIVSGSFTPNYEIALVDQVLSGVRNRVSDKIKQGNLVMPSNSTEFSNIPIGSVLSSTTSLQQRLQVSQSFSRDVNYLEVALSPQNEINDDINATYGYFNIGEYIGDPVNYTSTATTYPLLENLKNSYFIKYNTGYNLKDYIRLSKYYDNAVFQMIKDFVPVRAGIATGVVIKQHLLERNRVRPAQVSYEDLLLTGSIKPQSRGYGEGTIEVFSGGPGGSVNSLVGPNQAWTASYNSPVGLVTQVESSQYEFYNGEYSGSVITAQISYSLNEEPLLNNVSAARLSTFYEDVDYSTSVSTPVNLDLILSGSAIKASVPDSNYTSLRSITPRYLGSKNIGEVNYSQSFSPVTVAAGYPVDSKTPWFAFFNGIYNSVELGSGVGGNVNVSALINAETSDVITLTSDNQNIDFLGQLFKNGDFPAIVPALADIILEGQVEVQAAGEIYQTILMKSGSIGTGYLGSTYTQGALSTSYSSPTVNSASFADGVAVTQSLETSTFPSQASWYAYATTTSTNAYPITTGAASTVTANSNHPVYGLPSIYTTPGTPESRSLAANEIQQILLTYPDNSLPGASFRDFEQFTITSGSITNNLTDLPNVWFDNLPALRFYVSASLAEITTTTDWTITYPAYSAGYQDSWLDLINSGPNYPGNLPGTIQGLGSIYIYNKKTNEHSQQALNTIQETYLPLERGDFIRVGTTASIDSFTKVGSELISPLDAMRVMSYTSNSSTNCPIIPQSTPGDSTDTFRKFSNNYNRNGFKYSAGLLEPLPETVGLTDPADYGNQNFRIIRRVPTEFYVSVKTKPNAFTGEGLLLPHNFDTTYDARQVATTLGFIKKTQL